MIPSLPLYVSLIFILTTLLTLWLFAKADHYSKLTIFIIVLWLATQGLISLSEFYVDTNSMPPRFILLILPALLVVVSLFFSPKGRRYLDQLDLKWLTWLHVVRVPVEIVLFYLFLYDQVPQIMTFEGRNFDILSGLSAPIIAWFGYHKSSLSNKALFFWNAICLVLLFNIVITAALSVPFPFQQFAFDQPNVGILYFPFVWLPGFIVPVVLLSHLVVIRNLLISEEEEIEIPKG